ncbi:MAG TPA: hypothetical protein VNM16_01230 [Bacillota bacterium]|nr:hypothetical protein [Bacillota bacterium]
MSRVAFTEGLTAILISGGLLLGAAYAAAAVTQAGYQLDHAQHVLATAQDAEHRLEVQVATLQAPDRIAAVATTQLGMRAPSTFDTVQLAPVQDVPAPATHAAVIAIAPVAPTPGSVRAVWNALSAFVAHVR